MIERIRTGDLFSEAVKYGDILYLSGQVASHSAGQSLNEQLHDVLTKIEALLHVGGSSPDRLLSVMIYLTSAEQVGEFNRVWTAWLPPGAAPARTTVVAKLLSPAHLVEITATAAAHAATTSDGGQDG